MICDRIAHISYIRNVIKNLWKICMNKKYFTRLLCSICALSAFNSSLSQAILDPQGLSNYETHGRKLKALAEDVLSKDGYNVDWNPIGAGYNGAVFKAKNKNGEQVAVKLSFSDSSKITMMRSSSWKPYTAMRYDYCYLGDLELARRFVDLDTYNLATYNQENHVKKYRPVYLGSGLPKIHALYRFFYLDYDMSEDWSIVSIMDWVEGDDLESYCENNQFDDSIVLDWILKILDALKPLHDAGWYHMDLGPSNIMRRPDGSLCVIDLGKAIDFYDKNKNTVNPWHNPDLIVGRDKDQDFFEISILVKHLYESKNYICKDKALHQKILDALCSSDKCTTLYEKLSKLK